MGERGIEQKIHPKLCFATRRTIFILIGSLNLVTCIFLTIFVGINVISDDTAILT